MNPGANWQRRSFVFCRTRVNRRKRKTYECPLRLSLSLSLPRHKHNLITNKWGSKYWSHFSRCLHNEVLWPLPIHLCIVQQNELSLVPTVLCLERTDGVRKRLLELFCLERDAIGKNWLGWGLGVWRIGYMMNGEVWSWCEQHIPAESMKPSDSFRLVTRGADSFVLIGIIFPVALVALVSKVSGCCCCCEEEEEEEEEERRFSRLLILMKFDAKSGFRSPDGCIGSVWPTGSRKFSLANIDWESWIRPARTRS